MLALGRRTTLPLGMPISWNNLAATRVCLEQSAEQPICGVGRPAGNAACNGIDNRRHLPIEDAAVSGA